jgi:hypothetical protein
MKLVNFNYEGNEIPFRVDENGQVYMNANEMARPFGRSKRISNFTKNKSVLEYVNALHEEKSKTRIRVLTDSELVKSSWGGSDHGTWFQEDLAIYFAQWLNPRFGVWCNQRIKEILNQGFSALTVDATEYIKGQVGLEVLPFTLFDLIPHI